MAGVLIRPPTWPRSGRGHAWYQLNGGFGSLYRIPASPLINSIPQLSWMVLYRAAVTNQSRPLIGKFDSISIGWHCRQGGSGGTDDYQFLGSRTGTDLSFVTSGNAVRVNEWDCLFGTLDHTGQTAALYSGGPGRPVAALAGTLTGGTGTQDSDAALDLAICGRVATYGENGGGRGGFGMLGLWRGILTLAEMELLKELAFAGPWAMLSSPRPQSWNQVGLWFPGMDGGFVARDYTGCGHDGYLFGDTAYERFLGPAVPGWRPCPSPYIAAAVIPTEWYFLSTATGGWGELQLGGTPPADGTTVTGWDVAGLAAGQYARMQFGTVRPPSVFSGTAQPSSGPDDTLKDCWRSASPLSGDFAAGTWTIRLPVIATSSATEGANVRVRARIWKSANADGSSATELTAGAVAGTSVSTLQSEAAQTSTVTFSGLAGKTLTNEYLFVQVALETV